MNNKKKVFVVAVAVCLIAILSLSSLAWFSDTDEITNKFMVATSDDPADPDDIFSIDIFEQIDQTEDGAVEKPGYDSAYGANEAGGGFTFEHIFPGGQYDKKPWVRNLGAYDQWVRVKVTVTDAAAWLKIMERHKLTDLSLIFEGHNENEWTRYDEPVFDQENDKLTYTYYLNRKLEPKPDGKDAYLFTAVKIPYQLDESDMALLADGEFSLKLVAEAVQADNTGDNAYEAFDLVDNTQEIK